MASKRLVAQIHKKDKSTDKWETPKDFYEELNSEFNFDFDPCPIDWTPTTHPDGLSIPWGNSTIVNPPYSQTKKWIEKASNESKLGKQVVMLINACVDTIAFHKYIYNQPHVEVRFIKGRIRFTSPLRPECKLPNMKPSMLVIFCGTIAF